MSHRASFPIPNENNEFYIESIQGWIGDTRTENVAHTLTAEMKAKFTFHLANGYHPDCVICQSITDAPHTRHIISGGEVLEINPGDMPDNNIPF